MTTIDVNGKRVSVEAEADTPLLYVLRDELQLNGAKFGCGLGNADRAPCWSRAKPSFLPRAGRRARGKKVTTVEGLGTIDKPGRLQRAFIEEQAAQCGYCIPDS
jgi:aerobic-type carbon monoxide dehydrogenase small subunit (CoxS/CutS family)